MSKVTKMGRNPIKIKETRTTTPTVDTTQYLYLYGNISGWNKYGSLAYFTGKKGFGTDTQRALDWLVEHKASREASGQEYIYFIGTTAQFAMKLSGEKGTASIDNLAITGAIIYLSIRYQSDTPSVKLADVLSMGSQLMMAVSSSYKGNLFKSIGKGLLTETLNFAFANEGDTEIENAYKLLSDALKEQGVINGSEEVELTAEHIKQSYTLAHALGNVNPSNQNLLSGNI